MTWDYKRLWLA